MAEEALKKLMEQLSCSVCRKTYAEPKKLQCNHVFCSHCLSPLKGKEGLTVTCPTCYQVNTVSEEGVASLQSAVRVNCLVQVLDSFQKLPKEKVDAKEAPMTCSEHVQEELKLFCKTCTTKICLRCALNDGKHHAHDYSELKDSFEFNKKELSSLLEPLEEQVPAVDKVVAELEALCVEVSEKQPKIANEIHHTFDQLREFLSARETELIDQLDQVTQAKLKSLAGQKDKMGTTLSQLNSCLLFMKKSLKSIKDEMLMTKANTPEQVEELTLAFVADISRPIPKAIIVFSAPTDMNQVCRNYGLVLAPGLLDPSKCKVVDQNWDEAVVGEKCTVTLQAVDVNCQPCDDHIQSLDCVIVSEITGSRTNCSVERRGQSQYAISYRPTIKGRHQLHIRAEGQHIRASPASIAVRSPIEKLGIPVLTIGRVGGPLGVAVNPKGEVLVTEWEDHCISVLSPSGEKINSFGTCGSGQGQFQGPHGVTVDVEGNILVADRGNHRIQKLTGEGQFLAAVGSEGNDPLQFLYPVGVAFNASNDRIFVSDEGSHQVQVLNSDLTFHSTFGRKGNGKGQFNIPRGVACDSTGKVYVADSGNNRIQVFTAEGKFLRMFGRRGRGQGDLDLPISIAIDSSDTVYVSEQNTCRISIFTPAGEIVTTFGRRGKGPGEFHRPSGIAVDNSGVVYLCDSVMNIVKVF